jgi:hypothetical protein
MGDHGDADSHGPAGDPKQLRYVMVRDDCCGIS